MSGVPFTSEDQLVSGSLPFKGEQSSLEEHPFRENSADFVWNVIQDLHPDIFIWNAVPLHPHVPGAPKTNRKPTSAERKQFEPLLHELVRILQPEEVIAVGRVAERALKKHQPRYARHPSFGGAKEFRRAVKSLEREPIHDHSMPKQRLLGEAEISGIRKRNSHPLPSVRVRF